MAKAVTKENKEEWIKWIKGQMNTTNNAKYTKTGKNRVFLTKEGDIDIAKFVLSTFLETVKKL